MLSKLISFLFTLALALCSAACLAAALDLNTASEAELDSIKGIGPGTSGKILDERKKGRFKDWADLIDRIKGIGPIKAAQFSAEGVTVGGELFQPSVTPSVAKKSPAP